MAEIITQEFYDGEEWILVTSEVLYNTEGKPTGHYREISREYITKLGIFDNKEILDQVLTDIQNLRSTLRNDYFIIQGNGYFELYRAYQYGYWESMGSAVIDFFTKNNFIVDKYTVSATDITFICHTRPEYKQFSIILSGADKITQRVP